ncbi:M48 family metallopeptidase [Sphingomonas azotifigens]|uniref:M48 family metallopeptidase n=1 Tax=Sphingomonas azotifigens TaxID=330920 RepID=UPI000A02A9B5|nr:M48 family metallopeptidase [Sphingomonas azotifigens]
MIRRSTWWAAAAGLLLAGPAAAQPAALPPPYQGAYQPHGVDEIGLWHEADEEERQLAASPLRIRDERLTGYVTSVLCATVGDDRCGSVRVYVIRAPMFNASMTPNGTMRVYSGLLLRLRNEAELATVLGHEFGHYERRHTLAAFKERRSGTDAVAWMALLTSLGASYQTMQNFQNFQLAVYGGFFRHGRDQEREADKLGIAYLNRSSLRPQSATVVWQHMMAEAEASASAKGLKKPNFRYIAFAASHPPYAERAAYLAELAAPDGADRDDGTERYRAALAPFLAQFLDDQIKLNDFGASEYLIQNLATAGWTATLWLKRGDLYRTRGAPRDLAAAADFYAHAVQLDPTLAEAHRGLGLSLMKTGRPSEAVAPLQTYLRLRPDAVDAGMIQTIIPGGPQ